MSFINTYLLLNDSIRLFTEESLTICDNNCMAPLLNSNNKGSQFGGIALRYNSSDKVVNDKTHMLSSSCNKFFFVFMT